MMGFGTAALNNADVLRSRSSISAKRRSSCAHASSIHYCQQHGGRGSHAQSALRARLLRSASMILVRCFHSDSYVACSLSDWACSAAVSSVACTGTCRLAASHADAAVTTSTARMWPLQDCLASLLVELMDRLDQGDLLPLLLLQLGFQFAVEIIEDEALATQVFNLDHATASAGVFLYVSER